MNRSSMATNRDFVAMNRGSLAMNRDVEGMNHSILARNRDFVAMNRGLLASGATSIASGRPEQASARRNRPRGLFGERRDRWDIAPGRAGKTCGQRGKRCARQSKSSCRASLYRRGNPGPTSRGGDPARPRRGRAGREALRRPPAAPAAFFVQPVTVSGCAGSMSLFRTPKVCAASRPLQAPECFRRRKRRAP
jgi:hypothetical protein